ncbi:MAG: hypothetical protein EOM83_02215 [Clostridia bacterium]|nr:hypothetical protein [Clostridia bacterium]
MPSNLKAGSKIDYAESMAAAMEQAFMNEWSNFMIGADAPAMNDQMRLMFVAIAQGVVNHLKANHDAFKVSATQTSPGIYTGTVSAIE